MHDPRMQAGPDDMGACQEELQQQGAVLALGMWIKDGIAQAYHNRGESHAHDETHA